VAQVSLTVDADMQFRRTVGLRARAKRAVLDVLEAALEISKLCTGSVQRDAPLFIRVGSHLVTPSASAMIRFVAAASSSIEVKGICAALTDSPRDSNSEMTFV